jgi:hypothetical protein
MSPNEEFAARILARANELRLKSGLPLATELEPDAARFVERIAKEPKPASPSPNAASPSLDTITAELAALAQHGDRRALRMLSARALTENQLAICREQKIDPIHYLARRNQMQGGAL